MEEPEPVHNAKLRDGNPASRRTSANFWATVGVSLEGLMTMVLPATSAAKDMPADFRVSITNAPGATAYPVSSFTWLLIPAQIQDPAKRDAIKDFLKWMLTEGQKYNEGLTYAQLPKPVIEKELKAISLVQ